MYDVANFFYWRTWLPCMDQQANYFEHHLADILDVRERLLCYQLRIGLSEIYQNAREGKYDAVASSERRCAQIIARDPAPSVFTGI